MNKDFVADDTKKLPQNLLGALSTREYEDLITAKNEKKKLDEEMAGSEKVV